MRNVIFSIVTATIAIGLLTLQSCEEDNDGSTNQDPSNQEPTCSITNPSSGDEITQGDTVTISVEAEDEDDNLKEVRFYIDGTGTGSSDSFPYNYEWETSEASEGSHTIKAVAIDEEQAEAEDEVEVTVVSSGGGTADLEWVDVAGGTFQMGCTSEQSQCEDNETPVHTVTLSSFEITKYEITNAQYAEFLNDINCNSDGSYNDDEYGNVEYIDMDDSDCQINYSGGQFAVESGQANHPVIEVTWYGANAFAQWAGGRLPTEAEWEFAARGGNQSQGYEYSGSDNLDEVGWYDDNANSTHEVGQKQANELGIYDMSGNVYEWCHDWYDENYYSNSPENHPEGPSNGSVRVLRGGSWNFDVNRCRVANRVWYYPDDADYGIGFRIIK